MAPYFHCVPSAFAEADGAVSLPPATIAHLGLAEGDWVTLLPLD